MIFFSTHQINQSKTESDQKHLRFCSAPLERTLILADCLGERKWHTVIDTVRTNYHHEVVSLYRELDRKYKRVGGGQG